MVKKIVEGDVVICKDSSGSLGLVKGKEYTVNRVSQDMFSTNKERGLLSLKGIPGLFKISRFEIKNKKFETLEAKVFLLLDSGVIPVFRDVLYELRKVIPSPNHLSIKRYISKWKKINNKKFSLRDRVNIIMNTNPQVSLDELMELLSKDGASQFKKSSVYVYMRNWLKENSQEVANQPESDFQPEPSKCEDKITAECYKEKSHGNSDWELQSYKKHLAEKSEEYANFSKKDRKKILDLDVIEKIYSVDWKVQGSMTSGYVIAPENMEGYLDLMSGKTSKELFKAFLNPESKFGKKALETFKEYLEKNY